MSALAHYGSSTLSAPACHVPAEAPHQLQQRPTTKPQHALRSLNRLMNRRFRMSRAGSSGGTWSITGIAIETARRSPDVPNMPSNHRSFTRAGGFTVSRTRWSTASANGGSPRCTALARASLVRCAPIGTKNTPRQHRTAVAHEVWHQHVVPIKLDPARCVGGRNVCPHCVLCGLHNPPQVRFRGCRDELMLPWFAH